MPEIYIFQSVYTSNYVILNSPELMIRDEYNCLGKVLDLRFNKEIDVTYITLDGSDIVPITIESRYTRIEINKDYRD